MVVLDFGALPPEINSGRMYSGPGSGPMMAAAASWSQLATELSTAAAGYASVTAELTEIWRGPSAATMTTAAAPYVAWLNETAAQAEQTAAQSLAAAAVYEAAFAATVPPPVIEANRMLLMSLVATNFLGQNTPAIAAAEAAYAEMWAQDATAMYGYAAGASVAATLTPFNQPPQTTNPAGQSAQGSSVAQAVGTSAAQQAQTAVQLTSAAPLQSSAPAGATNSAAAGTSADAFSGFITFMSQVNTILGPLDPGIRVPYAVFQWMNLGYSMKSDLESSASAAAAGQTPRLIDAAPQALGSAGVRGPVVVSSERALSIGGLSVPNSWPAAAPSTAAEPLPVKANNFRALPLWAAEDVAIANEHVPPAVGPMRGVTPPPLRKQVLRMRDNRFTMPRPAVGG